MSEPGGSAQQEYERRKARDSARKRSNLPVNLAIVAGVGVGIYLLVVSLVPVAEKAALNHPSPVKSPGHHRNGSPRVATYHPPLSTGDVHLIGLAFAGLVVISLAKLAWGKRGSTEAWGKGARGERETARALEPLATRGYVLLNDLAIPGSRANVDHVLIAPGERYDVIVDFAGYANIFARLQFGSSTELRTAMNERLESRRLARQQGQTAGELPRVQEIFVGPRLRPLIDASGAGFAAASSTPAGSRSIVTSNKGVATRRR